jgi:cobalamin synthase
VATLWFLVAGGLATYLNLITPLRLVTLSVLTVVVAVITGRVYARRVGGITGDFLGATEQLSEVVALGVLAWRVRG